MEGLDSLVRTALNVSKLGKHLQRPSSNGGLAMADSTRLLPHGRFVASGVMRLTRSSDGRVFELNFIGLVNETGVTEINHIPDDSAPPANESEG
jgi:hypothetical protein